MGLWSKTIDRSRTGKIRLEDGDFFRWMDEICDEITRQMGWTCKYEHQISPVGHMFTIRFDKCTMSFPIQGTPSKIHLLAIVEKQIEYLKEKCVDHEFRYMLSMIHFNNIKR